MSRTLRALLTAALLFGLLASAANAQDPPAQLPDPKVVPIQVTGPPAQRLNFIIMGDGYQKDQQEIFRWLRNFKQAPRKTYVIHGEANASSTLASILKEKHEWDVEIASTAPSTFQPKPDRRKERRA